MTIDTFHENVKIVWSLLIILVGVNNSPANLKVFNDGGLLHDTTITVSFEVNV